VRVEIRELQRKLGLTTVMVTHDQEEALTMADRLVVMSEGRIRQIGSQQDLYERPSEKFVADFVGRSTFIDGRMDGPGRFVSAGGLVVACEGTATGSASLALRPERLALMSAARPAMDNSFPGAGGVHLLSRISGGSACPPVAKGTRHRADPEPAGTAAAGNRRTGPYRLEQIDRPRISIIISANQQPEASTMTRSKSRREVLLGAAALAGTASLPRMASAQAKGRIVVGTWGGDYARLLNKNIEAPLLIKDGWEVVQDQAGDPERRSKILAEMRLPRGTTDVQGLSAINMFQMHDAGSVLPIDYGKLKNAGNLLPAMKYPYGVGHIYSGKVGVYNPKIVTTPPVSYKDVFDPKQGNKLGIIDIQYQYTMVCAALAAGGKVDDLEPGKKLLLECKKAGMRIYPTNEAFAQGLKSEEFGIGVMWKARVVQWQNAGISVTSMTRPKAHWPMSRASSSRKTRPTRKAPTPISTPCWTRARRKPSPSTWVTIPRSANAVVAPDLNKRIGFTPDEIKKLVDLDYNYLNKNDVALKEWWDKELKG
jgi:putative spermidine/putrescine transport system substrate-binding protein